MTTGHVTRAAPPPVPGNPIIDNVIEILGTAAVERRSGILRVTGEPGGEFHLLHGIVIAVNSPGAPGVLELLAQPGRRAPGAMELRVLQLTATFDAAFAVAAGWIGDCFWALTDIEPDHAEIDPAFALELALLEAETQRRLRGIAPGRIAPHRHHLTRTTRGELLLRDAEDGQRRQILHRINGRRTCREIAFLLGRGLYAITVEVSRLVAAGAVTVSVTGRDETGCPARPGLPQRRRDASGINELYPPELTERAPEGKR
ncbi:hypothetical protein [Nocardia sp. NPDC051832]|uniref:hypothetical protein n=1 Tax=Nocardia sp. NPDC051832 TaxID=3155673 RepID=UPI00343F45BE